MSDHYELHHYKFDKVDSFMRCTYTGHELFDSAEFVLHPVTGEWFNTCNWERLSVNDSHWNNIEKALLQYEYNEALERSKQSDNPPLLVPTQLSDSIHEVIRQAVIASNVETYAELERELHELAQSIDAISKQTVEVFDKSVLDSGILTETLNAKVLDLKSVVDLATAATMDLMERVVALEEVEGDNKRQVSGLTARVAACEKTESSIWLTIQRGDGSCLK